MTFLEKNGFTLRADLETVRRHAAGLRDGDLTADELAAWIGSGLERKETPFNARRVFSALVRLTTVMEEWEDQPGMDRLGGQIDAAGHAICAEMVDAFELSENARERILRSYPAIDEHWRTIFRDERREDEE